MEVLQRLVIPPADSLIRSQAVKMIAAAVILAY